jgi:sec-independent protein translocase protein TatA
MLLLGYPLLFLQKFGIGGAVLIVVVILLLFGGKKIPQLMKGLGSGMNEFKKGMKEGEDEANSDDKETEKLK